MDATFLQGVKDEDVPRMLFLSINPTRVEQAVDEDVASTPTHTDGAAVDIGVDVSRGDNPSNGASYSTERLLSKFMVALQEQSITPVRRELHLRLQKLSSLPLHGRHSPNNLESNFSDRSHQLSFDEEDVLEFTEILERFNCPVPEEIKERFDAIVRNKKIPLIRPEGGRKKTFFAYSENNLFMEVGNYLSPFEVHEMYRIVKELAEKDQDDFSEESLNLPDVPLQALQDVAGLTDVAYYYLVLSLMRKNMLNRLYTHKLEFLLDQLQQIHMDNNQDHAHVDRALASLCRYPIASPPSGLCLIFHMMEDRPGAGEDLKRVKNLFENVFMYDVIVKINPTVDQIKFTISELSHARNKFYDSLVVWFMGHGSKSHLTLKDGLIHRRLDLIKPFTEIEWFHKKPKLFFIQACLTKENRERFYFQSLNAVADVAEGDYSWNVPADNLWQEKYADYTDFSNINHYADTLISSATTWYQPAARTEKGSLYVDTLVDQLKRYGSKESIESVLRRVHYNVNTVMLQSHERGKGEVKWKQAPHFESLLQKEFIFPKTPNQ